jgi:glycyl-tRNA synthetase
LTQSDLKKRKEELDRTGQIKLNHRGEVHVVRKNMIKIERVTRQETGTSLQEKLTKVHEYIPNVIEPSFGIGRILYALIEHVASRRAGNESRWVRHI